jgi:hypothetical protein
MAAGSSGPPGSIAIVISPSLAGTVRSVNGAAMEGIYDFVAGVIGGIVPESG